MLSHLSIQNMAIIESLQLDLNKNMTVLTGETGAGKSIIIDAISLLIGDRASTDLIRHHEEMAVIEGIFEIEQNKPLKAYLLEQNIPIEEQLLVKRTIKRVGNGQIRVNGELLSANQLKEIGQFLVDIHVQHDTHRLFHNEYNYQLIDNFDLTEQVSVTNDVYQQALKEYNQAKQAYTNFKKNAEEIQKRLDLILFQKNEIEKANLKKGELEELEERRHLILNSDKLHKTYGQILHGLNCDGGAVERLYQAYNATQTLANIDESLSSAVTQMGDIYYGLEEFVNLISSKLDELNYYPEELEEIESRLNELQQLKRKYRLEVDEIMAYYDQIVTELAQVEDSEHYEQSLYQALEKAYHHLIEAGEALNQKRLEISNRIKTQLIAELQDLQLFNAQFDIEFTRLKTDDMINTIFSTHGIYEIQFLLSTNKGEPMKPLNKVASGGELSRIMLALKTILNRGQYISTIIFDEIDTGVSGQVASSIGSKMKEIAKQKQVLCITHLPQVASLADHHIHVSKYEKEGRTVTAVKKLTTDERIHEVARMLSSDNVTESALLNAKQLLQQL